MSPVPSRSTSSPGRLPGQQPARRQRWAGLSPGEIVDLYPPQRTSPQRVLDVLLELFNAQHTSLQKTVSHKTRHDRAQFLRRFFRDLNKRAGFKKLPDPRNLGQKHIEAMVQLWRQDHLAPATIQTYLSFLRGLALWTNKPGFVRPPAYYGLEVAEYQRHEAAQRDKTWRAAGVQVNELIAKVSAFDPRVGASLALIEAFGLRRKESVTFRPFAHEAEAAQTGLAPEQCNAERYVRVKGKGGRTRDLAVDREKRSAALAHAQSVAAGPSSHMGDPGRDLKRNLRRFDYVVSRFGITKKQLGVTAHGLRHEVLGDEFKGLTGHAPPIQGGDTPPREVDYAARKAVAALAGHARVRAAEAYLGRAAVGRDRARNLAPAESEESPSPDPTPPPTCPNDTSEE